MNATARPIRSAAGPFKPVLQALQRLQHDPVPGMRIRTALVTARSAPAHERAIRTLMDWNIEVDEAMFLGGLSKGEFLREFEPDFFFDDQTGHIENAALHVPAGHVAGRHRATRDRAGPDQPGDPSRAVPRRSSTRTPPYSIRITPRSCIARSDSFTRCRDRPTR